MQNFKNFPADDIPDRPTVLQGQRKGEGEGRNSGKRKERE